MKSRAIASAIAAVTLSFGSLALAQGDGSGSDGRQSYEQGRYQSYGDYERQDRQSRRDERRAARGESRGSGPGHHNREARGEVRGSGPGHHNREARREVRGSGPGHHNGDPDYRRRLHRGGYIPHEYRNHQYYVNDWRSHRLSAPPRGHQWVQVGADYALIVLATGVIAHLLINQ